MDKVLDFRSCAIIIIGEMYRRSVEAFYICPFYVFGDSCSGSTFPRLVRPFLSGRFVMSTIGRLAYWILDACFLVYCAAFTHSSRIFCSRMHFPVF